MKRKCVFSALCFYAAMMLVGCPPLDEFKPGPPEYITVRQRAVGIILRWSPGKYADSYNIFWAADSESDWKWYKTASYQYDNATPLEAVIASDEIGDFGALTVGKTYFFKVSSLSWDNTQSDFSPVASIMWQ